MQDDISRIGEFLQKKNKRESIQEATVIAGDCTTTEVSTLPTHITLWIRLKLINLFLQYEFRCVELSLLIICLQLHEPLHTYWELQSGKACI
jgi:hypothetical protein